MKKRLIFSLVALIGALLGACGDSVDVQENTEVVLGGSVQKGPFLAGSSVLIKELKDGRSLTQTGNSFDGKVLDDSGIFKITAAMLLSQYVMVEATGFYRNEVTGKKSDAPITLYCMTDVTIRNVVHVNLLSSLEYERDIYLVRQEKMTVRKAKQKAQSEILSAFHIDNTDFEYSEDLSVVGSTTDGDGALLAMSVLFQGDRSVAELAELTTKFAVDIERDGVWDDAATLSEMVDWAISADLGNRLDTIRRNVESWNLGEVPDFESHIRNFWYTEAGLEECSDDNEGVVSFVGNEKSSFYAENYDDTSVSPVRVICREGRWMGANDLEKDTYGLTADEGDVVAGRINKSKYYFKSKGGWREATAEESVLGGCTSSRQDDVEKLNGKSYVCKGESWEVNNGK